MNFFDPSRPRQASGWPCWSESPSTALPSVNLEPQEGTEGEWLIRVMVYDDVKGGCWAERKISIMEIVTFLVLWEQGPEEALRSWFGVEAPKRRVRTEVARAEPVSDPIVSEQSMEDLGL